MGYFDVLAVFVVIVALMLAWGWWEERGRRRDERKYD